MIRRLLPLAALFLAACGSQPPRPVEDRGGSGPTATKPVATPNVTLKKGGGFYKDDGPGDNTPAPEAMEAIPDAVPRTEPLHRFANRPYTVLGKDYVPLQHLGIYKAKGTASWYGRKFHGQKTSSGEPYDMFGMTAAHTVLPIPSYVRVSNPVTGKAVVLRVNDRGPFHSDRIIDLSYTAAWKLGLVGNGSGTVVVESLLPGEALPPPVEDDPRAILATKETPPATTPAPEADLPGTYLQLGAFGNPDNADAFRNHIARELDWLADKLRTQTAGKILRIQVGPYRDRAEAEAVAEKVRLALGVKPTIVVR